MPRKKALAQKTKKRATKKKKKVVNKEKEILKAVKDCFKSKKQFAVLVFKENGDGIDSMACIEGGTKFIMNSLVGASINISNRIKDPTFKLRLAMEIMKERS